jgi:hypothetical protein
MAMGFRHLVAALLLSPLAVSSAGAAENAQKIPDFYIAGGGWDMINANATNYAPPPPGVAPPVSNDPAWPHVGNLQPGNKTDRVTDLNAPILQEWTKESIRKTNEAVIERGRTPFVATSLCWPGGVPTQLLVPTTVYIHQTPDIVFMFWERDHHVRKIYLNKPHSPGMMWYRAVRTPMIEFVCAENNPDPYRLNDHDMPTDNTLDF